MNVPRRVRHAFPAFFAAAVLATCVFVAVSSPVRAAETIWQVLPVGGGGWLTGIDFSPDGSVLVVRADTYGAYLWNRSQRHWTQLVTAASMPAADRGHDSDTGVYEIRVAPGLPNRLFMAFADYVFRSDDRGSHWYRTAFPRTALNANDDYRTFGPKMAVDPANPEIVYVGTSRDGMLSTSDGGRSWRKVPGVPASAAAADGTFPGITGIVFDRRGGTAAGRTKIIYAASYGHGLYRSANAGLSWTRVEGGPAGVRRGKIADDGRYYAVDAEGSTLWRLDSSGWTLITPGITPSAKGTWATIVVDPAEPARIIAARQGGSLILSRDLGEHWIDLTSGELHRTATDIPWLAWTKGSYMSVGDMLLDPVSPGLLWFAEGTGVWNADLSHADTAPGAVTFESQTAGIEQLVANRILVPPGGKPILAAWDRPVFYLDAPGRYPASHGPDNQHAIVMGWDMDYAPSEPTFVAAIINWWGVEKSGFSKDGGKSWKPFASVPSVVKTGKIGGAIAVSTPSNLIWVPSNNANPYYTKDGGATWTPISLDGVPQQGENGFGFAYYLNRKIVAADRVTVGTFYLYNYQRGLYRSQDGGLSWTLVHHGEIAPFSGFNAKLRAVPGNAGHLFFTSGEQGGPDDRHPAANPFMRSVDGGATWIPVKGVLEVRAFGFGKSRQNYPAIFIAGWVDGKYGIWRSDDATESWTRVGEFPNGILAHVNAVEGDADRVGTVYVGFGGAGYAVGSEAR